MAYFTNFPEVEYGDVKLKNITTRVDFINGIKERNDVFLYYGVSEGETPEHIAYDYYGSADLHWIILMFNDIIDPFYDWLLSDDELLDFVKSKYGDSPIQYQATHHWEKDDLIYTKDPEDPEAYAVSNYEYEERLNESKRIIKVLYPEYVNQLEREFEDYINEE